MTKWDERFINQAKQIAGWSKDPKHKVGAVLVDPFHRVLGLGYNGPPRTTKDEYLTDEQKKFRTLHAELNAILNCNGPRGATMYLYPFSPCAQCAAAIIQVGIERVIYYNDRQIGYWGPSQAEALIMLDEAGVYHDCLTAEGL